MVAAEFVREESNCPQHTPCSHLITGRLVTASHCSNLKLTATYCLVTASHCSMLQLFATHCNTLRHTCKVAKESGASFATLYDKGCV